MRALHHIVGRHPACISKTGLPMRAVAKRLVAGLAATTQPHLAVSPDQKTLYVVSNDNGYTGIGRLPESAPAHRGRMAMLAYDLSPDGTASFREVLVDYAPNDGPDGLVMDVDGTIHGRLTTAKASDVLASYE